MKFPLDDYIDEYIHNAKTSRNKKIAAHLKEIIPHTTHLIENIYNEIITQLKKEIENDREKNFKNAFFKVCEKYILIRIHF
jgi:vacuolar-type H+-ATPase subunit H